MVGFTKRQWMILSAGVVIVVGAFLPWVTARAGIFTTSVNGIEGDGKLSLPLGIALAVMAFLRGGRAVHIVASILAAGCLVIVAYDARSILTSSTGKVTTSIGIGLVATGAGAALALVAGLAALNGRTATGTQPGQPLPPPLPPGEPPRP